MSSRASSLTATALFSRSSPRTSRATTARRARSPSSRSSSASPAPDQGERGGELRKAIVKRARRKQAVATLGAVSTALHLPSSTERSVSAPLVGRDAESALLRSLLDGQDRQSVLLLGPEHAGKS